MKDIGQFWARPSEFARLLLQTLDTAAASSRRRRRDQKPDEMGLSLKRVLLERMLADDPDPDAFGDWLLAEVLSASITGPQRAVASDIMSDYHLAAEDPSFARWLAAGGAQPTATAPEHAPSIGDSLPIGSPLLVSIDAAIERARALASAGGRRILGITGAPGAGKSTLARRIVDALEPSAVYVPMDGFHLANHELVRLGRQQRKGAVDTFDAAGYVNLLERLRGPRDDVVYAPSYQREVEEPIAGSIAIRADIPLVVTEGNYLLVSQDAWSRVRGLLDEAWYVETDEHVRAERLVARHTAFGKSPDEARRWTSGSDQINADLVRSTRHRADRIIRLS